MSAIMALRERIKERTEKEHGVKLSFMPFFAKAATLALKAFPTVNAQIDGDSIVEIADLVSGRQPGRQTDSEITYYKSIGVPIQDLVTARHIERLAIAAGRGTEIEIGGDEG